MKRTVINIAAAVTAVVVVREVKHLMYDCAGSVESYVFLKKLNLVEHQTRLQKRRMRRLGNEELMALVIKGKHVDPARFARLDPSTLGGIKPFEYIGPNSL